MTKKKKKKMGEMLENLKSDVLSILTNKCLQAQILQSLHSPIFYACVL